MIHEKGIEINQNKTNVLLRKINFLRRFISNLSGKTQAFLPLLRLKGEEKFILELEQQNAFDEIKAYLTQALILMPHAKGKPMKLYICVIIDNG